MSNSNDMMTLNRHGKHMPVRVLTCRRLVAGFPIVAGSIVEVIFREDDDHRERTRIDRTRNVETDVIIKISLG